MPKQPRSTISKKNEYYISKERYLQLKYHCLQYQDWVRMYRSLDGYSSQDRIIVNGSPISDKSWAKSVEKAAEQREKYKNAMDTIIFVAKATCSLDPGLERFLLSSITTGQTYDYYKTMHGIPCSRGKFYKLRRKFFYILSNILGP